MSGIEAVGLISTIITIVDAASKLYAAIDNADHLPEAFVRAQQNLPLIHDTLEMVQTRLYQCDLDQAACKAITGTAGSCRDKAERLKAMIEEATVLPKTSRLARYRLAVRRISRGKKVEELAKAVLEDVQLLAANHAIKAQREAYSLSRTPPLPTFTLYGTGNQFNSTGSGTVNINRGNGYQYSADMITFYG